jgi:pimeloyl-ACP methyl ester carboxylesterase
MDQSPSLSDQGAYVQVNGLRMYYEIHGAGTPTILLHSGLETCQMWAPVVPSFSMSYQVITPDSRGYGPMIRIAALTLAGDVHFRRSAWRGGQRCREKRR